MAQLVQINISQGGVPKLPIHQGVVTFEGIEGDGQQDLKHHGGPDRAVCLYSLERIHTLQREGHSIWPGATGENLTVSGLNWDLMIPGVVLHIGVDVILEITSYAVPCSKISPWFNDKKSTRISQKLHPGWSRIYTKVVSEGIVKPGDRVYIQR